MDNRPQTKGMLRISEERNRQLAVFTPEHDDRYVEGELQRAATAYRKAAEYEIQTGAPRVDPPHCWPWAREWWKPVGGPARMFEKAGALFMAEFDRAQREFERKPFGGSGVVFALLKDKLQACADGIDSLDVLQEGDQPKEECGGAETITLTAQEIRHIAQFCGMVLQEPTATEAEEERETEIVIAPWPEKGLCVDGAMLPPHKHIAYLSDSPEEGCIPIGSPNNGEVQG